MSEIRALRDGESLDPSLLAHVRDCPICRSRLADAETLAARFRDPRPNDFDHPEPEDLLAYGAWLQAQEPELGRLRRVAAHVARCWECRDLLVTMPSLLAPIPDNQPLELTPEDQRRAQDLLMALAASDPSEHGQN